MYRFLLRPRWLLFHLLVLVGVIGMLAASRWQWQRYNDRQDFTEQVEARIAAEPQPLADVLDRIAAGEPSQDVQWYRATASGHYLERQLREINASQGGAFGANVLTPFQIDNGPLIIVNRGFVADAAPSPPALSGDVIIGGTVRVSEQRRTGELSDQGEATQDEVRRVDLAVLEQRLGTDLAPVYIELIASKPSQGDSPTPVPAANLASGPPHLSYAGQWLLFSLCAIAGWVFAVRRSLRTNRTRLAKELQHVHAD